MGRSSRKRSAGRAEDNPGPLTDDERRVCVQLVAQAKQTGFTSGRSDFEGLERFQGGSYGVFAMFVFFLLPRALQQDYGLGWVIAWLVGVALLLALSLKVERRLSKARGAFIAARAWYLEEVTGDGAESDAFQERKCRHQAAEKPIQPGQVVRHERAFRRVIGERKAGKTDLEMLGRKDCAIAAIGLTGLASIRESLSDSAHPLSAAAFLVAGLLLALVCGYAIWQVMRVKGFLLSHRAWNLADLAEGSAPDTRE